MVISFFRRGRGRGRALAMALVLAAAVAVAAVGQRARLPAAPAQGAASAAGSAASAATRQAVAPVASQRVAASQAPASSAPAAAKGELRAVWVSYLTLNQSREADQSPAAFQKRFDAIVQNAKGKGMNALVVHVRPFADALYPSTNFPWSHLVGGTQGVNPGYDPLAYMVQATHKAGLQFHAWVNPLRVQLNGTPGILAQNNPWTKFRADAAKAAWAADYKGNKYLDPGWAGVRQFVADGVAEIAQKYAVDGVQFDDYFYPDEGPDFDKAAYAAYRQGKAAGTALPLAQWRCANINDLLARCYRAVKKARPQAVFGVSPQGNLGNDKKIGADPAAWCSAKGYVDYICPQLYYQYNNPVQPYEQAAQTWKALVKAPGIKLYYGLGLYKAGSDADSGAWKGSTDVMARQVQTGRQQACDGFMFYAYDDLIAPQKQQEVQNVMKLFT